MQTRADISDPLIGHVLGDRYRVLDRIAAGGMGQVYRAAHARIASLFALKVLYGDLAHDDQMRARFQREAEASSLLASRYIVRVLDFGETSEGLLYLAMELIEGTSLAGVIARERALGPARTVALSRQIARGLAHAHERGIVHRDLKSDNVLVAREDEDDEEVCKLVDFGLAQLREGSRLTQAGQVFGTPHYMAPEQFFSSEVDARADLYALGVMMFEMTTGELPFDAPAVTDLARKHATVPPRSIRASVPAISSELEAVVMRLLAKRADERFPSARALLDALRSLPDSASSQTAPASIAERASVPGPAPMVDRASAQDAAPASIADRASGSGAASIADRAPAPAPAVGPASVGALPIAAPPRRPGPTVPLSIRARLEAAIVMGAPTYNAGNYAGCAQIYKNVSEDLLRTELAQGPPSIRARLLSALARAGSTRDPSTAAWEMRYALDDLIHGATVARPVEGPGGAVGVEAMCAEVIAGPRYATGHLDIVGDYFTMFLSEVAIALRRAGAEAQAADLDRVVQNAVSRGGGQRALASVAEMLQRLARPAARPAAPSQAPISASYNTCPVLDTVAQRITHAIGWGAPAFNQGDAAGCFRIYRQAAAQIVADLGSAPACSAVVMRLRGAADEAARQDDVNGAWTMRRAFDEILAAAARRRG